MRLPRIFVNLQRYGELAHVDKNWRALCRPYYVRSDQPPGPDSPNGFSQSDAALKVPVSLSSENIPAPNGNWQHFGLATVLPTTEAARLQQSLEEVSTSRRCFSMQGADGSESVHDIGVRA
jgi:hypothetical protein